MTREDEIVLQGYVAAANGLWAGTNPYDAELDRVLWLEGFITWHWRKQDLPVGVEVTIERLRTKLIRRIAEIGVSTCPYSWSLIA